MDLLLTLKFIARFVLAIISLWKALSSKLTSNAMILHLKIVQTYSTLNHMTLRLVVTTHNKTHFLFHKSTQKYFKNDL